MKLTPRAWKAIKVAEKALQEVEEEWTALLGADGKEQMRKGLEILARRYLAEPV